MTVHNLSAILTWAFAAILTITAWGGSSEPVVYRGAAVDQQATFHCPLAFFDRFSDEEATDNYWEVEEEEDGFRSVSAASISTAKPFSCNSSQDLSNERGRVPVKERLFLYFCSLKIFC